MTNKVSFFYVVADRHFDTLAAAQADLDSLLNEGYRGFTIEKYAAIDGDIYSAEEGERELQFQSDMQLASERNSLIDFAPQE